MSLSSGAALWTYTSITNADFDASPAIDRHGLFVYAADMDGRLYALAARDHPGESRVAGDEVWNVTVGSSGAAIESSIAVDIAGNIYLGSGDGSVYAFSQAG